jgi:hypothetical protein
LLKKKIEKMEIKEEIEIKNPEMQGEFKIKPEIEIKTNKWNVNTETCYLICVIENNALQKDIEFMTM